MVVGVVSLISIASAWVCTSPTVPVVEKANEQGKWEYIHIYIEQQKEKKTIETKKAKRNKTQSKLMWEYRACVLLWRSIFNQIDFMSTFFLHSFFICSSVQSSVRLLQQRINMMDEEGIQNSNKTKNSNRIILCDV